MVEKEDMTDFVKLTKETISKQILSPKINKTKIKLFVQVIIVCILYMCVANFLFPKPKPLPTTRCINGHLYHISYGGIFSSNNYIPLYDQSTNVPTLISCPDVEDEALLVEGEKVNEKRK